MERSKAIKCPTVCYQLAGSKKVQQELCRGGAVEKYFTDAEICGRLRSTFANQYSLDLVGDSIKIVVNLFTFSLNYFKCFPAYLKMTSHSF